MGEMAVIGVSRFSGRFGYFKRIVRVSHRLLGGFEPLLASATRALQKLRGVAPAGC